MKKVLSILLALFFLNSSLFVSAASIDGKISNFKKISNYSENKFKDVSNSAWYTENVKTAYEYGLITGSSKTTFEPNGNITIAETITIADRIYSIYTGDKYVFESGDVWYRSYVDYAVRCGIINENQFSNYDKFATRAEFASIMSNALPKDEFNAINNIEMGCIPDISNNAEYTADVYMLYNAGILSGNDKAGTFSPYSYIQRSEVSAIITRMVDKKLRKSFTIVVDVTRVSLDKTQLSLSVGETAQLTATVYPLNATDRTISWSSTNPSVVSVSQDGKIKGLDRGYATVYAKSSNNKMESCRVTVTDIEAISVELDEEEIVLEVGETYKLNATIFPSNTTDKTLIWDCSSMDGSFKVSSNGTVTAIAPTNVGRVYVRTSNFMSDSCRVIVKDSTTNDDYVEESTSKKQPSKKAEIKIVLKNKLPEVLTDYDYKDNIDSVCKITNFEYEISDYTHQEEQTATLYFTGEKVHDKNGENYSSAVHISWKLYDEEDYVVDSGTALSTDLKIGEKFKKAKTYAFDLLPGTYYLELLNTD